MSHIPPRFDFRAYSQRVPPNIPAAIQRATARLGAVRAASISQIPEWETLRQTAHDLRLHTLDHLDDYIAQVEREVTRNGGHIHRAHDAAEANATIVEIARQHRVKTVVKGKSMAAEEIGLNHALEQAGVRAVETDVGEFIIQLAGVGPSHILGPATHMTKEEIAALFRDKLGVDAPPEPRALADIARAQLREHFLRAEMGVTGANFVVAETGTAALVTNEGNGRMCATLPEVHVVVAGIDKIIPDWNSLAVLLPLLVRSATGQKLSCYTSFITGARQSDGRGPREFHLVLLDNGRTRILRDPVARETLLCLRCAACLNICPVYNQVGGHAYGWVYSGPIGAILSPQLLGTDIARALPFASTLCGACAEVCPVKIPIPQILLHLRHRVSEGDATTRAAIPLSTRVIAQTTARVFRSPMLYRFAARVAGIGQTLFRRGRWLPALPPPLSRWTQTRPMPAFDAAFRWWWSHRISDLRFQILDFKTRGSQLAIPDTRAAPRSPARADEPSAVGLGQSLPRFQSPVEQQLDPRPAPNLDALLAEVNRLAGKARRVDESAIGEALRELVETEKVTRAALWATPDLARLKIAERLRALGVEIVPRDADKLALAQADLGITEVDSALAESGTLGLVASPEQPRALSLLPRVHLALVRPTALRADLRQIFEETKREDYVLITGLNRTSDIESNPVLGAHGPQAMYVWAIE